MHSLERIVALLPWCSSVCTSVCPSGTGVHCDHMVHFSAVISLWMDNPVFWHPDTKACHCPPTPSRLFECGLDVQTRCNISRMVEDKGWVIIEW